MGESEQAAEREAMGAEAENFGGEGGFGRWETALICVALRDEEGHFGSANLLCAFEAPEGRGEADPGLERARALSREAGAFAAREAGFADLRVHGTTRHEPPGLLGGRGDLRSVEGFYGTSATGSSGEGAPGRRRALLAAKAALEAFARERGLIGARARIIGRAPELEGEFPKWGAGEIEELLAEGIREMRSREEGERLGAGLPGGARRARRGM